MATTAPATTFRMRDDIEDIAGLDEACADDTPLLPLAPRNPPRWAGAVLAGLMVTGCAFVAATMHTPASAMQPSNALQASFKPFDKPFECHIDSNASEEVDYSPMVCMRSTDKFGLKYHSFMVGADVCETAKNSNSYSDVVCCKTNKCGGHQEKEDVACYVDGTFGGLAQVTYIRPPFAMGLFCSKFVLNDGSVFHQPLGKETCDFMKQSFDKNETWAGGSKFYKEVLCCSTDYCNGDGVISDKIASVAGAVIGASNDSNTSH